MNPYIALAKLMLPHEISESFELVKVEEKEEGSHSVLHLYLDEFETPPQMADQHGESVSTDWRLI